MPVSETCVFAHIWPSHFHSFLKTISYISPCLSISALLYKAPGHEFTSRRCSMRASQRRKSRKKKSEGKRRQNCETPMYFISSYIIHFEMHLGWCKSVQRHPLFRAFTLKCLCGWSVLRQFGPTSLPHPHLNKSLWSRAALIKLVRDL